MEGEKINIRIIWYVFEAESSPKKATIDNKKYFTHNLTFGRRLRISLLINYSFGFDWNKNYRNERRKTQNIHFIAAFLSSVCEMCRKRLNKIKRRSTAEYN